MMETMNETLLFAYGTLQEEFMQELLIGRRFTEIGADSLQNYYTPYEYPPHIPHAIYKEGNRLRGTLYRGFTDQDIARIDRYEGGGYVRMEKELSSGHTAYVYISVRSPEHENNDLQADWLANTK